jgi:hypothetical protein
MAFDCRVFCEMDPPADGDAIIPEALREHVEQKWAGVLFNQAVAIRPQLGKRHACAFFVDRQYGGRSLGVFFHQFGIDTDSAEAVKLCPPGKYKLTYTVTSSNFPTVSKSFPIEITDNHEDSATLRL